MKAKGYTGKDYTVNYERMRSRSKNSIEIQINISENEHIRETVKIPPTAPNCELWNKKRNKFEVEIVGQTFKYRHEFPRGKNGAKFAHLTGDNVTIEQRLRDYAIEKITTNKQKHKPLTIEKNTAIIANCLIPEFGHLYVSELTHVHLSAWADELEITQKTLNNKCAPLRSIIKTAIRQGVMKHDIFNECYPEAMLSSTHVVNAFTPEEHKQILAVDMPDDVRNLITFWLFTGLRTSEIYGLTWNKFNKKENTVIVDEQLQSGVKEESTKTASGNRKFKLLDEARSALLLQEKITKLNPDGIDNPGNLIFMDMKNNSNWDYNFSRTWEKILEAADVEYRKPYNMRHTFATMMLSIEGEGKIELLAQLLGHKTSLTTRKAYIDGKVKWVDEDWSKVNAHFAG